MPAGVYFAVFSGHNVRLGPKFGASPLPLHQIPSPPLNFLGFFNFFSTPDLLALLADRRETWVQFYSLRLKMCFLQKQWVKNVQNVMLLWTT